ncbi:hypothetical protein [Vreelandella utahensis]|uniref:hypothetical protein n=1 Tax=Vreelandella halophila TaxID=86177 RepID=UPI000987462D|nr:hypothetical protein [Halomonas utahensis]
MRGLHGGLRTWPEPVCVRIVSGEDRILIWTVIVHLPGIQFSRPEATVAFDVDPTQAATTRRRIGENPSLYPLHLLVSRRC